MIKAKHILTTEQTPDRLYIPPTIEVVEVEEECVLAGSPITGKEEDFNTDSGSDKGPSSPRPGGGSAKENFIFFNDNFTDESFDEDLDY